MNLPACSIDLMVLLARASVIADDRHYGVVGVDAVACAATAEPRSRIFQLIKSGGEELSPPGPMHAVPESMRWGSDLLQAIARIERDFGIAPMDITSTVFFQYADIPGLPLRLMRALPAANRDRSIPQPHSAGRAATHAASSTGQLTPASLVAVFAGVPRQDSQRSLASPGTTAGQRNSSAARNRRRPTQS